MIKTRRESEISKRRHPAGRSKSKKTMQPLDGTVQSPAHPDPQPENPQRTEKVVESKGTHAVVAGPGGAPEDSELAELRAQWQNRSALERTKRLEVLMAKGHSKRALARAIGCSEGSIRWHLNFSHLKPEEKQAFQQGELSGRKALKNVHERKVKERLERLKLSGEERTKEIERMAEVSVRWFEGLDLNKPCRDQLMYELSGGPYNIRRREFARHAPPLWGIPIGKDPEAVIESCRPQGNSASMSGPEYLNYCFTWFARWSQRLMPDRGLRHEVFVIVARRLP